MGQDERYNGWTNYETWNAKLWIDNDQNEQEYWKERAQEAYDAATELSANARLTGREIFTQKEKAVFTLRDTLKDYYDENMAELGVPELTGMYADLLNAALSQINWHEIATSMMEDVDVETGAEV